MTKKNPLGKRKTSSSRESLPQGAKKLFDFFLNNANFSCLHPNDYDKFYQFICYCHKHAVRLDEVELEDLLLQGGFHPNWPEKAKSLAHIYLHGRKILEARRRVR